MGNKIGVGKIGYEYKVYSWKSMPYVYDNATKLNVVKGLAALENLSQLYEVNFKEVLDSIRLITQRNDIIKLNHPIIRMNPTKIDWKENRIVELMLFQLSEDLDDDFSNMDYYNQDSEFPIDVVRGWFASPTWLDGNTDEDVNVPRDMIGYINRLLNKCNICITYLKCIYIVYSYILGYSYEAYDIRRDHIVRLEAIFNVIWTAYKSVISQKDIFIKNIDALNIVSTITLEILTDNLYSLSNTLWKKKIERECIEKERERKEERERKKEEQRKLEELRERKREERIARKVEKEKKKEEKEKEKELKQRPKRPYNDNNGNIKMNDLLKNGAILSLYKNHGILTVRALAKQSHSELLELCYSLNRSNSEFREWFRDHSRTSELVSLCRTVNVSTGTSMDMDTVDRLHKLATITYKCHSLDRYIQYEDELMKRFSCTYDYQMLRSDWNPSEYIMDGNTLIGVKIC